MAEGDSQSAPTASAEEPQYGGYTRFELELEVRSSREDETLHTQIEYVQFVQCLANPWYLNHLATQKLLDNPSFISYLDYLQYFKQPRYAKFLTYVR